MGEIQSSAQFGKYAFASPPSVAAANSNIPRRHAPLLTLPRLPFPPNPALAYLSRLAPSSRRTMRKLIHRLTILISPDSTLETLPWSELRYADTLRLRAQLVRHYAPSTANLALAAIRGVLREAWRLGLISCEDFERAIDLAPVRGSTRRMPLRLGTTEIQRLFDACSSDANRVRGIRDGAILSVLYGGGLRRGELTALSNGDYSLKTLRVCGKGQQYRIVYLPEVACACLDRRMAIHAEVEGPLFVGIRGSANLSSRVMSTETIAKIVRRRAAQAGLGALTPHDLRRAMATQLLSRGADVFLVQRILGHRSVSTTTIYDRRKEEAQQHASELLFRA
jgi:integrase/recombinase XerD